MTLEPTPTTGFHLLTPMPILPEPSTPTWDQLTTINDEKAWHLLRRLNRGDLLVLLGRALRHLEPADLESIFGDHAQPHELGDTETQKRKSLLEATREFTEAALSGEFYEDFTPNWRNSSNTPDKSHEIEARLALLFDRCVEESATGDPADVCASYELILDLLQEIDKFEKDIVFFADEGGVWQFGISWRRVLPPYFHSLAKTVEPQEYARRAKAVVDTVVDSGDRAEMLKLLAQVAAGVRA